MTKRSVDRFDRFNKDFDDERFKDPDWTIRYSVTYIPIIIGVRKEFNYKYFNPFLCASVGLGAALEEQTYYIRNLDYIKKTNDKYGLATQIDTGLIFYITQNFALIPKVFYHYTNTHATWNENKVNFSGWGAEMSMSLKLF